MRRGHGSLGAPKGKDGDDDDNVWCPQLRARSPFALLHLWVAERFDTFKTVEVPLATGVTQGKCMPLIPHFTLGITHPTHGHLLLVIRKAMYASYSTLYSRHASSTQRV